MSRLTIHYCPSFPSLSLMARCHCFPRRMLSLNVTIYWRVCYNWSENVFFPWYFKHIDMAARTCNKEMPYVVLYHSLDLSLDIFRFRVWILKLILWCIDHFQVLHVPRNDWDIFDLKTSGYLRSNLFSDFWWLMKYSIITFTYLFSLWKDKCNFSGSVKYRNFFFGIPEGY